jgi:hypothetical protein
MPMPSRAAAARNVRRPRRSARCVARLVLALAALETSVVVAGATAQDVDSSLWSTDGTVFAAARSGNTLYIGGTFTKIGPASGGGVPLDVSTGTPLPGYAKVAGEVHAAVGDGQGGWFIGGEFVAVGGQPRSNLAHITRDGKLGAWAPQVDNQVECLALSGSRVYVGGYFTTIEGVARHHLAALDVESGEVLDWNPDPDRPIYVILPHRGAVYVGGEFSTIGGQSRMHLAAIDSITGGARAWVVDANSTSAVNALAVHDTVLFVGGRLHSLSGWPRYCLAAVGLGSGVVLPWDAHLGPPTEFAWVNQLVVRDTTLFVAGLFKSIGGAYREGLAALDVRTALATEWDPSAYYNNPLGANTRSLALSGDTLFVSFFGDSLGGREGAYLAALNANTGARLDWNPHPNRRPEVITLSDGRLFAGGNFSCMGSWEERKYLAAMDAGTGRLLPWNPTANDYVEDLAMSGGKLYVAGAFSSIGGQPRSQLAALDPVTGVATSWSPAPSDGWIFDILPRGASILVGGWFKQIGGQPRRNVAAIDTATGLATPWNPDADDMVRCFADGGSVIYLGGWFRNVGGLLRYSLAAVDPVTGRPAPWDPGTDGTVETMLLHDGKVYVGGSFHNIGRAWDIGYVPRERVAAINGQGLPTEWRADANERIYSIARSESTIYVAGRFDSIGGQHRQAVAALDVATGAVRDWNPGLGSTDCSGSGDCSYLEFVMADDEKVYLGGVFDRVGWWPQEGFAAVAVADAPPVPPPSFQLALVQNHPNPSLGETTIRYVLAAESDVDLTVFDIQGRRISSMVSRVRQDPGIHQVTVGTSGWPAGCYLYRLTANGRSITRRMVVLN